MASIKMQCVTCDRDIDGQAESAAARYVGAGFCDECIVSKSVDSEIAGPYMELRAYPLKDFPILGEIDWNVSQVLKHSAEQAKDAIAIALVNTIPPPTLKEARFDLMCKAIQMIHDGEALKDQPLSHLKASRRCDNLDKSANDIVELFWYISSLSDDLPSCIKKKLPASVTKHQNPLPPPPTYSNATAKKQSPQKLKSNLSYLRPAPIEALISSSSIPPPPPSPMNRSPDATYDVDADETFRLVLNATPGVDSISLGEATLNLYPNTLSQTPACTPVSTPVRLHIPPLAFKTPAELRCRKEVPATSSPLNSNAPPFIPSNLNRPNPSASITQSTSDSASQSSCRPDHAELADLNAKMDEIYSELRIVKAELKTHKQFVDEIRALNQTPPPQSTNWAEAVDYINLVNTILEKHLSPTGEKPEPSVSLNQDPSVSLIEFSPYRPRASQLNAPPITSPVHDEKNQDIAQAMVLMQREFEWMVGHIAGQDQKILDLHMEVGNLKQDALICPPQPHGTHPAPPTAPPREPYVSDPVPPPLEFADNPTAPPEQHRVYAAAPPPPTQPRSLPNIPTSNRFDCLTADDADIYDVNNRTPSSQPEPSNAAAAEKPVPRPRPRPRRKKRPKVRTIGSSMVANQDKHQRARGLDAEVHTYSGYRAERIQQRVTHDVSPAEDKYIVCAGGTNNIPKDDVYKIIHHVGNLIDHTRDVCPTQHIIVPQILHRYDTKDWVYHNEKINRVNCFLKHRCTKDPRMHFLNLDNIEMDELYDNLHMDYCGKDKYAEAVANLVFELERA